MKLFVVIAGFIISLPAIAAADYLGKVAAVADGDTFTMESGAGKVRILHLRDRRSGARPARLRTGRRRAFQHDRRKNRPLPAGRRRHPMRWEIEG